jgi:steroid delta-isomerase-like uncharacterized protein
MLRSASILVCTVALLTCSSCAQTPEEVSRKGKASASKTREQQTFENLCAVWSGGDLVEVDHIFTDDLVYEDVTADGFRVTSKEEVKEIIATNLAAVPDMKDELTRFIQAGDWAAAEWVWSGTHTGDYPDFPATGKSFFVRGVSILQFEDGKIKRDIMYWDVYDFLHQLEVVEELKED